MMANQAQLFVALSLLLLLSLSSSSLAAPRLVAIEKGGPNDPPMFDVIDPTSLKLIKKVPLELAVPPIRSK